MSPSSSNPVPPPISPVLTLSLLSDARRRPVAVVLRAPRTDSREPVDVDLGVDSAGLWLLVADPVDAAEAVAITR